MADLLTYQRREISMDRVATLFTSIYSRDMIERHVRALRRLTRHGGNERGFLIRELAALSQVLAACRTFVKQNDVYVEPLCDVIRLCGRPFLKEKASDESEHGESVVRVMEELGGLVECNHPSINIHVANAVIGLFTARSHHNLDEDKQPTSVRLNIWAIEESHVTRSLVSCLSSAVDSGQRLEILEVLQQLSVSSACCCDMLQAQAAHTVCTHMLDTESTNKLLFVSVDLLWNLIASGSKSDVAYQLGNRQCTDVLQGALCRQMVNGKRSLSDRELRNDILIICYLVAAYCPNSSFVESGFVHTLVLFSTFTEVKSNHDLVRGLRLSQASEDFELKKVLISLLVTLSSYPVAVKVMMDGYVLLALFSFVKPNDAAGSEWTVAQFEELQLEALAALAVLCPQAVESYMTCQGSTRLLLLLEWCASQQGHFVGLGNGFHSDGGYGNRRSQMRHCLRVLLNMASLGNEMIHTELSDQGAVQQLVQLLCCEGDVVDWKSLDEIDLEMRCDVMLILSALCDGDMHRKELFGDEGVTVLLPYFRMPPHLFNSGKGHHQLMLAAVICCWTAVVWCSLTEDIFLELEGMFLLLDLMEVCPGNMENMLLGTILDLCDNPKSLSHVTMWRGRGDTTISNLAIKLWQAEEEAIHAQRDDHGLITDTFFPLAGDHQRCIGVCSAGANEPSPAILDVVDNMRAKIYALLQKIGFKHISGLGPSELISLSVIEQYMELKLGEVWREITNELAVEKFEPVAMDRELMEQVVDSFSERITTVCTTQQSHLQSEKHIDTLVEQKRYDEMRVSQRMKEKAKLDFRNFMKRTSDYETLKHARNEQRRMIEATRVNATFNQERKTHLTHQMKLQTTTFSGRHVNVESTRLSTQKLSPLQA